jgi:hypothetical protein
VRRLRRPIPAAWGRNREGEEGELREEAGGLKGAVSAEREGREVGEWEVAGRLPVRARACTCARTGGGGGWRLGTTGVGRVGQWGRWPAGPALAWSAQGGGRGGGARGRPGRPGWLGRIGQLGRPGWVGRLSFFFFFILFSYLKMHLRHQIKSEKYE